MCRCMLTAHSLIRAFAVETSSSVAVVNLSFAMIAAPAGEPLRTRKPSSISVRERSKPVGASGPVFIEAQKQVGAECVQLAATKKASLRLAS